MYNVHVASNYYFNFTADLARLDLLLGVWVCSQVLGLSLLENGHCNLSASYCLKKWPGFIFIFIMQINLALYGEKKPRQFCSLYDVNF